MPSQVAVMSGPALATAPAGPVVLLDDLTLAASAETGGAMPSVSASSPDADEPRRSRMPALAMLAGGVILMLAAALVLNQFGAKNDAKTKVVAGVAPAPSTAPANPLAISISGPGDISLVRQVYEPGHDSGWHTHPGIHAVAVISGTLTVYDRNCQAQTFGPGQPYIGGQELHVARNETTAPLEMMVTYVSPSASQTPTQHLPAPAGCSVGQG